MLKQLHIENIAVVEKCTIELEPGFNVLTGETGAGKSIIIDSLGAALGARTARDLIRSGEKQARVSALFTDVRPEALAAASEMGLEAEDGAFLLQRELSAEGKSVCRVNGAPATAGMVRELAKYLLDIHGQHDNQQLLNPENHYRFIDLLAENEDLYRSYQAAYRAYCDISRTIKASALDEAEKQRKTELLSYQINELEAADIKPGEWEELKARSSYLANAERIARALTAAEAALSGGEEGAGAAALAAGAAQSLQEISTFAPELSMLAERLSGLRYELEDALAEVCSASAGMDTQPGELEQVEERLDTLYRLSRKYGETEEDMLIFLERARQELDAITFSEEHIKKLEAEREAKKEALLEVSRRLTDVRKQSAMRFQKQVAEELAALNMPSVVFNVSIEHMPLNSTGGDRIEFLISANPGEAPRPIAKIASGGELSRIMLAIKNVLADKDRIDTMIFDEVDAGISGRTAYQVGRKLRETAGGRQVICVTHLAQIAAQAGTHFLIEKAVEGGRTYTSVSKLTFEGRKQELARIIGGSVTQASLHAAEEMLRRGGG